MLCVILKIVVILSVVVPHTIIIDKFNLNKILQKAQISNFKFQRTFSQSSHPWQRTGNTKGGSITVLLTSCLTGLDLSVLQIKTKIVSCHTANSKPVKQEVNGTLMLPPLVFPAVAVITPFA
jgi:hypothetical protein